MVHNPKARSRRWYARTVAMLLAAASMVFTLAGCSAGNGDEDADMFPDGYEPPEIEKLEHTDLKFLFPGSEPASWKNVKAEIEERISGTLNASLEFRWVDFSQYFEILKVLDTSGEIYDALAVSKPEPMFPDFTVLAREGKLKDITDIFPSSAPLLFSKYTGQELEYATVDGRLYAVPSLYPKARCSYLMVDDALFRKYNMPDITDYDKYEMFLKTIKENEPDLTPGAIANSISTLQLFARASGYVIADEAKRLVYKWDDPGMKLIPWEKTPEFHEAVNRVISWYMNGYLACEPDYTRTASFFMEDMLAPPTDEPTKITILLTGTQEIKESNPFRLFHLYPEKPVQRENPMGSFYSNGSFIFPAASDNTERVLQFLEWVQQSKENYYLLMYGIEGKDYILTDGIPVFPENMDVFNSSYMYWGGWWAFVNLEYDPKAPVYNESGTETTLREFLDRFSEYPPHGAFYPDYGPLQQAADDRSRIFNEFEINLLRGRILDPAKVDVFIRQLDELGSDELAEEAQEQMTKG